MMGNHQGRAVEPAMLFESAEEIEMKIRKVRPEHPRHRYSASQKRRAMFLLKHGTSARSIARWVISPSCSIRTIYLWRNQARQIEADRVQREDLEELNAALVNAKKK